MTDRCSNCATELPAGARFCPNCGTPTAAAPAPIAAPAAAPAPLAPQASRVAGERKPVTALFADVVGSVTLAERMDPEDWSGLMSRALGEIEEAVSRYDGSIAKLLGDGVLALFGAEVAHEDDPERAVRAALEILAAFERLRAAPDLPPAARDLAVRIGINSGLALVGSVSTGDGDRPDMSAYGDTVNVAARLQSAARPGHGLLAAATYRLVAHAVDGRDVGELELRGRSETVHAYELVGLRVAPSSPRGVEGLRSPMVGRREQLNALEERLAGLASGRGCGAVVIGEPGIGKSRLVAELRHRAETDGSARWVEGRARSYGRMQADHLLVDLVRATLRIAPPDAATDPVLAGLVGDGAGPEDPSPEGIRAAYLTAVGGLLRACASEGPMVALLEDLHWSDESSADTLAQLLPVAAGSPILVLATTRDEPDVPGWHLLAAMRREFVEFEELRVGPLSEADARTLVGNLLEIEALPSAVRDTIVARADGNPFFVEETLRMLIDRGALAFRDGRCVATEEITRVEIPETIHGLLLARIDRLASEPRRALRIASVIGREFDAGLLGHVLAADGDPIETLRDDLDVLAASGLVYPVRGSEPPLHRFRHALVQEAAYDSLLRAERTTLHGVVGRALEAVTTEPEDLDNQAARISEHFELAGEPAVALPWARCAADAAFVRYALPEALAQFRRAIGLAKLLHAPVEGELTELYLRAGRTIELMDRYGEAVALYEEMLDAARERGDRAMELAALAARATGEAISVAVGGEQGAAEAHALEALELARELGDHSAEAKLLWVLMLANRFNWGDYVAGVEYGRQSIAIAREHGLDEQAALSAQDLAQNLGAHGQLAEAYAMANESIAYWLSVGNLPLAANGLRNRLEIEWLRGDLDTAERTAQQSLEIDERTGNVWGRAMSRMLHGGLLAERGRFDLALARLEEALAIAEASELLVLRLTISATLAAVLIAADQPGRAQAIVEAIQGSITATGKFEGISDIPLALLAAAALAAGRREEAAKLAEPGTAFHPDLPFAYSIATLWSAPIEAAIAVGNLEPARSTADRILAHAIKTGARLWQPESRRLRALVLAATGDRAAAYVELDLAVALALEIGMEPTAAAIERTRAAIAATA